MTFSMLQKNFTAGFKRFIACSSRLSTTELSGMKRKSCSMLAFAAVFTMTVLWSYSYADSQLFFVHTDHLQTPRQLTDASGIVVWRGSSEPFGETTADVDPDGDGVSIAFNIRFPGQYFDHHTGLHYNYFRDYDPTIGRYIQSDPIGLNGGINTYAYVDSNPLSHFDPLGLAKFCKRLFNESPWVSDMGMLRDAMDLEFVHEQLYFNDGTNLGYFPDGVRPESADDVNRPKVCEDKEYDDNIMKELIDKMRPRDYDFIFENCQDWASDLRREYEHELFKRRCGDLIRLGIPCT